ncbi:sulfotransferase 1C4 [Macrosteles quadrilineatus]|uniref:sulfotransferase 1C4 n=1 Tax=Macrosteles quadrilineatus TaxID=74068 RepID=UPI0023E153D1|nr:sulfotransferase 1C4 [Macrosteles quadrilineatus]XP_054290003.1 sulfotransferase 1C4 [Macrosteles quadrilineatus]
MSDQNGVPLEITPVEEELNRQLLRDFTGERTGFLRVGPQGYFLPSKYAKEAKNLYNFQPRSTDTWVVTFPRSGTTWTQEMVWLIANKLDFETAKQIPQTERFPFFEFSLFLHDETKEEFIQENASDPKKVELVQQLSKPGYQILEEMSGPRFIKTHLPFSLLPKNLLQVGCKVIYVARNPKDVAVSFYHLNRLIRTQGYRGDFPKYWDYFEKSLNPWTPYWSHVNEGWQLRNHPNVLFLFYEEMNKDLKKTINRVSEFLNGEQLSVEDTGRLANFLDISNFRKNPAVNYQPLKEAGILIEGEEGFIRKGKTGGWVEEFTPELSKRADEWINNNLKLTDMRFPGMCDA